MADRIDRDATKLAELLMWRLLATARETDEEQKKQEKKNARNKRKNEKVPENVAFAEFAEVARPFLEKLFRHWMRLAEWEDLVQETLLRIYEQLEKYDPLLPAKPWVMKVAWRIGYTHCRKDKNRLKLFRRLKQEYRSGHGSHHEVDDYAPEFGDLTRLMQLAIRCLSKDDQAILKKIIHSPKSRTEIAAELQITTGCLATQLCRIRGKLRKTLIKLDPSLGDSCRSVKLTRQSEEADRDQELDAPSAADGRMSSEDDKDDQSDRDQDRRGKL